MPVVVRPVPCEDGATSEVGAGIVDCHDGIQSAEGVRGSDEESHDGTFCRLAFVCRRMVTSDELMSFRCVKSVVVAVPEEWNLNSMVK